MEHHYPTSTPMLAMMDLMCQSGSKKCETREVGSASMEHLLEDSVPGRVRLLIVNVASFFSLIRFSYFNTVGSKEGWTPSTFTSSRSNRQSAQKDGRQQRAEDFMDEEDLADAAEAQIIQTQDAYAGFGSTGQDEKRKGFMMDLLRPEGETMGTKLLRKMGWRDGQGIGARVRRHAFVDNNGETKELDGEKHFFAPPNSEMISFVRKDDCKGLGYTGSDRLDQPSAGEDLEARHDTLEEPFQFGNVGKPTKEPVTKVSKAPRTGIGIGILNDNGSDEEDPYEVGPRISYNRTIGGDKKKGTTKALLKVGAGIGRISNPLLRTKPVFMSKKASSTTAEFHRCHDGRLPLDGFVLSEAMDAISLDSLETAYPQPKIPDGWQSARKSADSIHNQAHYQSPADAAKQSKLDSKSRAAILGESMLPGKSIFDYMSTAARDRIASATGRSNLPAAKGEVPVARDGRGAVPGAKLSEAPRTIPELSKELALAALGRGTAGWMPYADDEAKRGRYRVFLEFRGLMNTREPLRPQGMEVDSWLQELREFAHAAQVFKPMTGMMASRFTTSSAAPQTTALQEEGEDKPLLSVPSTATRAEDPAIVAARMGMFGPLTRSIQDFFPTRLLCKRFNVKPPDKVQPDNDYSTPTSGGSGTNSRPAGAPADLVSQAALQEMVRASSTLQNFSSSRHDGLAPEEQAIYAQSTIPKKEEEIAVVDPSKNEALESQKAGEAVFNAIFGDDSD